MRKPAVDGHLVECKLTLMRHLKIKDDGIKVSSVCMSNPSSAVLLIDLGFDSRIIGLYYVTVFLFEIGKLYFNFKSNLEK